MPEVFDAYFQGEDEFYDRLHWLNGRFVMIFGTYDKKIITMKVLNDATGMRSVFYTENLPFCVASHPDLAAQQSGAKSNGYGRLLSKYTGYSLPGNLTTFEGIRQLIPNHFIDSETRKHVRFFPREDSVNETDLEQAVADLAENLRKQVNFLAQHVQLLCSLAAGIDSRVTLTATKDVSEKIKYFTHFGKSSEFNEDQILG